MTTLTTGGRRTVLRALVSLGCVVLAALLGAASAGADALPMTLEEAQQFAVENSEALAMARAEAEAARARLAQATAGFFPAIGASATYTRLDEAPYMDLSVLGGIPGTLASAPDYLSELAMRSPATAGGREDGSSTRIYLGSENVYSVGLSATQPIFMGGALLSARGAAKHGARAGKLGAERAEQTLRYGVTQAYVGLAQARSALDVMKDLEAQMRQHLSDAEAMYEQGMLLQSDLLAARARMSQVELDRSRAEHAVSLASAALAFTVGIDVDTEIEPVDTLDGKASVTADLGALTRRALDSRPDLLAAGEAALAADNAVSIARSDYFPKLAVVGNYNWDRPNRQYDNEFYSHWSVTLALQMNVFDWGLTWNRVREARAGLDQVERSRDMLEESVRLDVKRSYLALDEAITAVGIARTGLSQARESMRVVREGFRNGTATNAEVLAAQTALTTAEMNRVTSLAQLRIAEAGLDLATGLFSGSEETR